MRWFLAFLLFAAPAYADEPPDQWQYEPEREILGSIDPNQCVLAIYGPELREERGGRMGGWYAPVDSQTVAWLEAMRRDGKLSLYVCDEETGT